MTEKSSADQLIDQTLEQMRVWIDKGRKIQQAVDEILSEHEEKQETPRRQDPLTAHVLTNLRQRAAHDYAESESKSSRIPAKMLLALLDEVKESREK